MNHIDSSNGNGSNGHAHLTNMNDVNESNGNGFNGNAHERELVEKITVNTTSVGSYLSQRLVEAGASTFFTVPGDFILGLIDSLLKNKGLKMVGCCNELNAGYAADGFCRATGGLGVLVVTYMVGGLSAINGVAGAYSEDLPLLIISGGPNTNDGHDRHLVHHTIGEIELYQSSKCFEPVVAKTFVIRNVKDCAYMIDQAILTALTEKKPVYLEIPVNMNAMHIPNPSALSFILPHEVSDSESLNAAVKDILARIHLSVKPVLLGGPKLKKASAINEFKILKNALGCGFANLPDAKGLFDEDNEDYLGTYWAGISSPDSVQPVVENTDLLIVAGALMSDYTTVGWTALYSPEKFIQIFPNHAIVCGRLYSNVLLADLLGAVALKAPLKNATINAFLRFSEENCHTPSPPPTDMNISLTLHEVHRQVQDLMTPITSLIVEAGDSWFFGQRMKLPYGAKYYWQMQYGSIGWATGATLGIALAEGRTREVVAIIGDGAFQVTAQEVSTMIRQHVKATIFLMNNRGYTAEVEIHDGPYNDIKNWNYAGIMEVFNAGEGDGIGIKVQTAEELKDAIHTAEEHKGVTLIEVTIDRDDCTVALLQFGSKVAKANGRI